jgi:hypothetical protein
MAPFALDALAGITRGRVMTKIILNRKVRRLREKMAQLRGVDPNDLVIEVYTSVGRTSVVWGDRVVRTCHDRTSTVHVLDVRRHRRPDHQ